MVFWDTINFKNGSQVKYLSLILSVALLLLTELYAQNLIVPGKTISGQEYWRGNILIEGDVIISPTGRLTIEAGSSVLFRANSDKTKSGRDQTRSELLVYGELIAKGTIDKKIRFSSAASSPRMQDWFGISILSPAKISVIDYAVIEFAYNGLVIKKSNPQISNSQLQFNFNAGIVAEVESAPKITGNIISDNDYAGIICNTGARPVLSDNMITHNQIGIIIFGTANPNLGALTRNGDYNIGRNALVDNREFNIHNHSTQNIQAENNSWGVSDTQKITQSIYDSGDDRKYGEVVFTPILGAGINLEEKILLAQESPTQNAVSQTTTNQPAINQTERNRTQIAQNSVNDRIELTPSVNQVQNSQEQRTVQTDADSSILKTPADLPERLLVDATPKTNENLTSQADQSSAGSGGAAEPDIDFNQVFLDAFLDEKHVITNKVVPVVRDERRGLGEHGRIVIRVIVDRSGKVESANIMRGLNPYYDEIAIEAARKFEFKPGTIGKKPVRFATSLFFEF